MLVKVLLVPLFLLLTSLAGVCSSRPKEIYMKSREMVALQCPHLRAENQSGAKVIWTGPNTGERDLSSDMSSAEQRPAGVLLYGRSLVILSATVSHQGNYSCSLRHDGTPKRQTWFRLMVYSTQSREYEERTTYPKTCYTQEFCQLNCPNVNIPDVATPNITSNGIIWHKEGESFLSEDNSILYLSVKEDDRGVYICTRSYLYLDQTYNMTFKVVLDVQPNQKSETAAAIILPNHGDVVHVDLGSSVVIPCKAATFSDSDSLSWLSENSFVERNESLPVFCNVTRETNSKGMNIINSLIIKKVTKEQLSKNYTCKLGSEDRPSSFVTITLAQKACPSYASLAVGIVCTVVGMVLTTAIYVKFKISVTLFLRDTLGCHRNASDKKSYDAFLMCYKSDTEAGLNEEDRGWLESVLEEKFGYSLCLYDRDVLPGKAVADAVLDCLTQSRTVVLVPASTDPGLESGLLSVIHSALVERETRLVFITTESKEALKSGSVSEALQLLSEAGDCVTWKGKRSMSLSSFFWKQLRYHLPALKHTQKKTPLSQRV